MLSPKQIRALSDTFVSKTWTNPFLGFNRGYRLDPSNARPVRNRGSILDVTIRLPAKVDFAMYMLPINTVTWIKGIVPLSSWVTVADYCNLTGTLFSITNPRTSEILDITQCYIGMIDSRYPILIVPFANGAIDVNIRMSSTNNNIEVTSFNIRDNLDPDIIERKLVNPVNNYQVIANGHYYNVNKVNELPVPSKGVFIYRPSLRYIREVKLSTLDTYRTDEGSYFIIDMDTPVDTVHHCVDTTIYLFNEVVKRGGMIDNSSEYGNIVQLTNNTFGVRVDHVTTLLTQLGIPSELARLTIYIPRSDKVNDGNDNFNRMIDHMDATTASKLISNGDPSLDFVYGETMQDSKVNKLHLTDIPNVPLSYGNFDIQTIDLSLNAKRASIEDSRTELYQMSGRQFQQYGAPLGYSRSNVDISGYIFPRVFTKTHDVAVFGVDYYLSEDKIITLLNDSYVIDQNGRYSVNIPRVHQKIDLSSVPIFNHPDMTMELMADNIFLHPNIDYGVLDDGLVIWKAGVTSVDLSMYLTRAKESTTKWITNNTLFLPSNELYGFSEAINVFTGDVAIAPSAEVYVANGTPVTIQTEFLDLFSPDTNLDTIDAQRETYRERVNWLAQYYTESNDIPPTGGFTEYYKLVSPMCIDLLSAMRGHLIDPSMDNILINGIEKCIPEDILKNFKDGYDPTTSTNAHGMQFVIIQAHDEDHPIDVTRDEWNFLRHVNSTLLNGRITLEQYYRITYE